MFGAGSHVFAAAATDRLPLAEPPGKAVISRREVTISRTKGSAKLRKPGVGNADFTHEGCRIMSDYSPRLRGLFGLLKLLPLPLQFSCSGHSTVEQGAVQAPARGRRTAT